jgi:hypothetical protein
MIRSIDLVPVKANALGFKINSGLHEESFIAKSCNIKYTSMVSTKSNNNKIWFGARTS